MLTDEVDIPRLDPMAALRSGSLSSYSSGPVMNRAGRTELELSDSAATSVTEAPLLATPDKIREVAMNFFGDKRLW